MTTQEQGSEKPAGKRLFVGARVSVGTANALAGCAESLARRARDAGVELRWAPPANYHVTLMFLGWTRTEAIGAVCDRLAAAVAASVTSDRLGFRTTRLGGFPSLEQASVLWAGVEDTGGLTALANAIGDEMAGLGFAREHRPYHPHVTIARARDPRALREVVLPMAEQMFGDTKIDGVTLFESETKSSGSVYSEIAKISFLKARNQAREDEKRQTPALERGHDDRGTPPAGGAAGWQRGVVDETQTDDGWPRGQGPTD